MSKDEFLKIKTCVLKVHLHCDGCRTKVKKILQKIDGVYTFNIEPEQGKVTVSGDLDPATLIKSMAKHGKHVEIWPEVTNSGKPNQMKNMQHDKGKAGKKGANPNINNGNQPKTGQKQVKGPNPDQKPDKDDLAIDDGNNDDDNDKEEKDEEDEDQIDNGKTEKLPLMGNNDKKGGGMGKNGGKKGGTGEGKNEGKKGNQNQGDGGGKKEGKKGNQNQGGGKNEEKNIEGRSEDGKKGGGSNGKTEDKKRGGGISNDDLSMNSAPDRLYFQGSFGADVSAGTNPNPNPNYFYHQKQLEDTNEMFHPMMMYAQPRPVNHIPHPCPYYHYPYPYPFTYPQPRPEPYVHAFSDENQSPTCCIM